jgi:uncharacterized protein (TIGR02611 family)
MPADEDAPTRHPLLHRLEAGRQRHRQRAKVIRVLYALVGLTVLFGGVAMLVTPGPAFVVIPFGLFLLALEFTWAERALEASLNQAEKAKAKAAETTTTQRILTAVAGAAAAAGVAVWAIWGDIPLLPV